MIRDCGPDDVAAMFEVINEAAEAYRGIIPADRWHEPYMPMDELSGEIAAGVAFIGEFSGGQLTGVMGLQPVNDVCLIRHAYVRATQQGTGVGSRLMAELRARASMPMLVGTWAAATWAIGFYLKHGFRLTDAAEKDHLLKTYWDIPDRQIETSVVLADGSWKS